MSAVILLLSTCDPWRTPCPCQTAEYTVTYDANGAESGSVPVDSAAYAQCQTVTVLGNTGDLAKSGYSFAGWNTASDGSGTTYTEGGTFTMGAVDVTLYARWTTIAEVSIAAAGDSFTMGDGSYGPDVSQTISYDYAVSKYQITNAQFAEFIADGGYSTESYWTTNGWSWKGSTTEPSYWTDASFNGDSQPVVGVSWYEAVAFCNWLSTREGLTQAHSSSGEIDLNATGYRLPTEVEWEYAAAKGAPGQTERIYAFGSTWESSLAVCSVSPASASQSADVGSKSPGGDTPQGLADMSGNVWEWCGDSYTGSVTSTTDWYYFEGDSTSEYPVIRGGAWCTSDGDFCFRVAFRLGNGWYSFVAPDNRDWGYGFRVVRRLSP